MCDAGHGLERLSLDSVEDCARLDRRGSQPCPKACGARIILGSTDRLSVAEVVMRAGVGRPTVWY
jgi:hypothetical protein